MANRNVSQLPENTDPQDSDWLLGASGNSPSVLQKINVGNLPGSSAGGSIKFALPINENYTLTSSGYYFTDAIASASDIEINCSNLGIGDHIYWQNLSTKNVFFSGLNSIDSVSIPSTKGARVLSGNYLEFFAKDSSKNAKSMAGSYTINYLPGQALQDPYHNNIVLFLKGIGANNSIVFTDNSISPKTITANGEAKISTSQSKYNGSSILLNADGDFLTLPPTNSGDFALDTDTFCIEAWIYPLSKIANYPSFIGNYNAWQSGAMACACDDNSYPGKYTFVVNNYGGTTRLLVSTSSVSYNTWTHYAVAREDNIFRLFINGTKESEVTWTGSVTTVDTIRVGKQDEGSQFRGHILARITKGNPRYTANFNPETETYLNE